MNLTQSLWLSALLTCAWGTLAHEYQAGDLHFEKTGEVKVEVAVQKEAPAEPKPEQQN